MNCQEFEGTWKMITVWPDDNGRYEHQLTIGVDGNCRIAGKWTDLTRPGVTAIVGQINGNDVKFERSGGDLDRSQSYIGHWTPTFAGGTMETYGLFYMEKI